MYLIALMFGLIIYLLIQWDIGRSVRKEQEKRDLESAKNFYRRPIPPIFSPSALRRMEKFQTELRQRKK